MSAKNFALIPRVFVCLALSHFSLNANLLDSSSQSSIDSVPQSNAKSSANYTSTNSTNSTTSLDSNDKNSNDLENDSLATQATQSAITQNQLQQNTQPRHPIITQILNRTQLYGHIGTFGKSSILGKERDSYLTLHFSANLSYDFYAKNDHLLNATIGIWGATSLLGGALRHNAHEYIGNHLGDEVGNDWNNNNAFLRYEYRGFSIQAGRFDAIVDWVGEHMQGAHIAYDFKYGEIYGAWINEYAHSSREETSNFVEFKELYYGGNELVLGAKLGVGEYRLGDIYAYYLTDFFYMLGGKISQDFRFGSSPFSLQILAHGNYLSSQRKGWALGSINEDRKLGNTYLLTIQPNIAYERGRLGYKIGAGYARTGANDFLQAHMGGNLYLFEAEDETPFLYNIIAAGGWHNGTHQTNMFQANTDSAWGFVAFKYDPVAFNLTARYSKGNEARILGGEQLQIALGANWNIYKGLHLGLVGVYMEQNNRDNKDGVKPTHTSYGKAFLEYRFLTPR
ncbi:hypothetical protein [Helicobacter sp. T3_23-1059]